MQTVLILGYEKNLLGQVLKGFLHFYGGQWADVYCTEICENTEISPMVYRILEEDSIPVESGKCITLDQAGRQQWDYVICPKPIEKVQDKLQGLTFNKLFSFETLSEEVDLNDEAGLKLLEGKIEQLKKRVLVFVGKEFLGEQQRAQMA